MHLIVMVLLCILFISWPCSAFVLNVRALPPFNEAPFSFTPLEHTFQRRKLNANSTSC
jgi:hypothetical protein